MLITNIHQVRNTMAKWQQDKNSHHGQGPTRLKLTEAKWYIYELGHYLNKWLFIVDWILRNNSDNWIKTQSFSENACEIFVCKMFCISLNMLNVLKIQWTISGRLWYLSCINNGDTSHPSTKPLNFRGSITPQWITGDRPDLFHAKQVPSH